jgi:hypothetical protein
MKPRNYVALILASALGCVQEPRATPATSAVGPPPPLRARDVLALIDNAGADSARRTYFGGAFVATCGAPVIDSIATGDSLWLVVAERLGPGSDACAAEGIGYGASLALARSPAQVLRVRGDRGLIDHVCALPFDDGVADSVVRRHYTRVMAAVAAITEARLVARREQCRAALKKSYEAIFPTAGQRGAEADRCHSSTAHGARRQLGALFRYTSLSWPCS